MGKKWKLSDFIFLGSKTTVDTDCIHEIKRHLLLRRKAMINLESVLKSTDCTDKGPYSQSYRFFSSHVWMWEFDPKDRAECQKIGAFELLCWGRLLRAPWIARWSNQPVLKETSPEYSLEELMLKLKLQYFGHLMHRTGSMEKILMLGKIEGRRRRWQQRMRLLDSITNSQWTWVWAIQVDSEGQASLVYCSPWGHKELDMT